MSGAFAFSINRPQPLEVAVEIASGRVSGATLEFRGGNPVIASYAVELLPERAVAPSLTATNTQDRASVMTALNRVLERVGRPRRVGLIVPDVVAKVSLVRFESVPARTADLDQLVRWQVRKAAPFPIEEAQVSYVNGLRTGEGQEFVVSLAKRSVIEEYEGLCAEAGAHAGLVDVATFNVINAVLAGSQPPGHERDWLLVNVAADSSSIAIMRGSNLIFFRNRAADGEGTLADVVHQSAMYYEDRLKGGGFSRVLVAGAARRPGAEGQPRQDPGTNANGDIDEIRRTLEGRLSTPIETVDPRRAAGLADRIVAAPALLDAMTPLVGLMLRDHAARATVEGGAR